ncbi:integrase core domain-containing protein [Patescibacteria group bacterium]|nr:integrase core domain-containing protein [Patescibacteria group bacterium]
MENNNIDLTKTEKIKFAYILYKENTKYDKASKSLGVSRRTYANWVKSFKMIGIRKTIKDFGKWKNGSIPANKISNITVSIIKELRKIDGYGRWKTQLILKRDYGIDISERSISNIIKVRGFAPHKLKYPTKKDKYEHIVPFYPGDLVEADPMYIGDLFICNFCDWITRMRYSTVMTALYQENAMRAIKEASVYFPFKIKRLQWDNGGEAQSDTEKFVKELFGTSLNHTPPHSPKYNGLVERLNRTIRDEEVGYGNFSKKKLESILKEGIYKYNNYRPHYSLKGKTPSEIWNVYCYSLNNTK